MTTPADQPEPRRRRVAPTLADPMAPVETPVPPSKQGRPRIPERDRPSPAKVGGPEATVGVFVRVAISVHQEFEDLIQDSGMTKRAMFEALVTNAHRTRWPDGHR